MDRSEFTFGGDFGHSIGRKAALWCGYRYGIQEQATLFDSNEDYDNRFHRFLAGVEGDPTDWLKATIAIGPELRRFGSDVAGGFGSRERMNVFVDAALTFTLSPSDTVRIAAKRFEQPGSGGRSTYQDLTIDMNWRHELNARWTIGLGGRAYNTEFRKPAMRDDWAFTGTAFVNVTMTERVNAEFSCVLEKGLTHTPHASGREYTRHLLSIGVRYTFR